MNELEYKKMNNDDRRERFEKNGIKKIFSNSLWYVENRLAAELKKHKEQDKKNLKKKVSITKEKKIRMCPLDYKRRGDEELKKKKYVLAIEYYFKFLDKVGDKYIREISEIDGMFNLQNYMANMSYKSPMEACEHLEDYIGKTYATIISYIKDTKKGLRYYQIIREGDKKIVSWEINDSMYDDLITYTENITPNSGDIQIQHFMNVKREEAFKHIFKKWNSLFFKFPQAF